MSKTKKILIAVGAAVCVIILAVFLLQFKTIQRRPYAGRYEGSGGGYLKLAEDGSCIYYREGWNYISDGSWKVKRGQILVDLNVLNYTIYAEKKGKADGLLFQSDDGDWTTEYYEQTYQGITDVQGENQTLVWYDPNNPVITKSNTEEDTIQITGNLPFMNLDTQLGMTMDAFLESWGSNAEDYMTMGDKEVYYAYDPQLQYRELASVEGNFEFIFKDQKLISVKFYSRASSDSFTYAFLYLQLQEIEERLVKLYGAPVERTDEYILFQSDEGYSVMLESGTLEFFLDGVI
jgi:hypothetical protein